MLRYSVRWHTLCGGRVSVAHKKSTRFRSLIGQLRYTSDLCVRAPNLARRCATRPHVRASIPRACSSAWRTLRRSRAPVGGAFWLGTRYFLLLSLPGGTEMRFFISCALYVACALAQVVVRCLVSCVSTVNDTGNLTVGLLRISTIVCGLKEERVEHNTQITI